MDNTNGATSSEVAKNITRLNETMTDQNGRFEAVSYISHPEILHLAQIGITDEQIDSFQELLETARTINYQGLAENGLKIQSQIREIDAELETQGEGSLSDDFKRELELAASLAPRKATEIYQIGEEEKNRSIQVRRKELLAQRALLEQQNIDTDTFLSEHGGAWVIPQAIPPSDRLTLHEMVDGFKLTNSESEFDFVDIIPLTPVERDAQAGIAERAKTDLVTKNASNLISFYLSDQVYKTVTVEELIRFLYVVDAEVDNGRDYRSNVTTLLGPKVNGRVIDQKLHSEYGLELQYGMRILRERQDGRLIERRRTRIYRTVPADQEVISNEVDVVSQKAKRVTDKWEARKLKTPAEKRAIETSADIVSTDITPANTVDAENELEIEKDTWQTVLHNEALKAIATLKLNGLFDDNELPGSTIRAMSLSAKMGTKTMRTRMATANLIPRSAIAHDIMTREQRVLGILFNTHQELIGSKGKSNQREALAIVSDLISKALEADK